MKQVTGQFDNNDENDPFDRYVNESSKQDFKLLQIDVQGSRKNLALENVLDDMSYLDHTQQSLYETSNSHYSVFNNPLNDEVKQNLMMKKKQYVRKFGTPEESERTITQKGSTRHQAVPETVRQGFESVESHNRLGTNEKHSEGYLTLETERKEIYEHSTDFLIESCGYKKIVVMDKPQNLNRSPPEAITDCLEERSPGSSHGDKNRGTAKFGDKIGDSLDRHRGEYFVGAESPSDRQRGPRNLDSEAKGLGSDQMGGYSSRGYMGLDGGENNENYNSSNGQNTPLTRKGLGGYQQGKKLHRDQIMTEPLGFQNNHKKGVVGYKNDENGVDKGSRMLKKITSLEDSGKDSMIEASPYERYMVHMYDSNNLYGGDDGSLEQINLTNFINEPSRGGLGNSVINPAILNQKDSALYMAKLNDRTVDATISDLGKSNAFEFFGSGNEENYVGPMNQKVVLDDTEVLETGRKTQRSGSDAAPEANQVVSQNVSDLKRPPEAGVGRERLARGELVEERRPLWPINDPYGAQVRQKPRTTEMSKKPNQTEIYNGFESSRALQHHEQENKIYINRMQKKPEKVVQMLQKSDPRSQNHQEIEMGGGHLTPIPDPKEETMRLRSSTNRQSNRQGTTTMGVIEPPTQHSTANKAAANHQVVSSFNPSTPIQPQKLPGNLSRRSQRAEHAQASPHHSQKQLQENLFKKKRKRSESSQEIYSRRVIQTTTTTPHQEYLMQTEPVTRTNFRSRNSSSRTRADPRLSNRNLMINQNIESTAYKLNPMQTITTSHNNSTHKMVTPQRGGSLLSATANLNNRAFSKAKIAVGGYEGVSDRQLGAQGGPSISVTPLNQKQPSTIEMKTIGTVSSNMVTEQTRKSEGIAKKMPQALSHRHMSHIKQIKGTINQPVSEIPQRAVYYRIKGLNGENLVFDNVEDLRNEMTRQNKIIEQHRRGMDVSPLTPSVSLNNTQNKANNHPSVSRPKSPNMSITPTRKILLAGAVTPQTRVIPSPTQMNSLMPSSISSKTCNSERHLKSQREVMKLQQHIQSYQFKGDKKVKAQVVEEVAGAQQSTQSQLSGKNVLENGIGSFKVKASQQSTDGLMGHFGDDFDENEVGEVNLDNFGDYMSKIAGGSHAVNSNLRANSWKCFYLRMKRPLNYLGIIKVSNKILVSFVDFFKTSKIFNFFKIFHF